jgi:hypothetical protein
LVPSECYSELGAECNIRICGRKTLVLRAFTTDDWEFDISGDVKQRLRDFKTVPGGIHKSRARMDIDEYDYLQVYELIPKSSCFYRVSAGECDTNPVYMLEHCATQCKFDSMYDTRIVQLKSSNEIARCLEATDSEHNVGLVFGDCNNGNLNQDFVLKKRKTENFFNMLDIKTPDEISCLSFSSDETYPVRMNRNCLDSWEILNNGSIKNLEKGVCLGRDQANNTKVAFVDCENSEVLQIWSPIDSRYELFDLHIRTTNSSRSDGGSKGPFSIVGYKEIPKSCYEEADRECDFPIYGRKEITIRAETDDEWDFTLTGDVLPYTFDKNGAHIGKFPILLDSYEVDHTEEYFHLKMYNDAQCHSIQFKTHPWDGAESSGMNNFEVDGYGYLPTDCYSSPGKECTIQICGRRTLVLKAYTTDTWEFEVSGDHVGAVLEVKTNNVGKGNGKGDQTVRMDIDKNDYVRVYDFLSTSSCFSRAMMGKCESNSEYMNENCKGACDFLPLIMGKGKGTRTSLQLMSSSEPPTCLTTVEDKDRAPLIFTDCSNTTVNATNIAGATGQEFTFKSIESRNFNFFNFGRLFNPNNKCIEMDTQFKENEQVFIHHFCWDTWEILGNGALKNYGDGMCIGRNRANTTLTTLVDCDSEHVEIWNPLIKSVGGGDDGYYNDDDGGYNNDDNYGNVTDDNFDGGKGKNLNPTDDPLGK